MFKQVGGNEGGNVTLLRRIYERNLLETGVIIGTDNDHIARLFFRALGLDRSTRQLAVPRSLKVRDQSNPDQLHCRATLSIRALVLPVTFELEKTPLIQSGRHDRGSWPL